jgi:hypothetical protein
MQTHRRAAGVPIVPKASCPDPGDAYGQGGQALPEAPAWIIESHAPPGLPIPARDSPDALAVDALGQLVCIFESACAFMFFGKAFDFSALSFFLGRLAIGYRRLALFLHGVNSKRIDQTRDTEQSKENSSDT